MLNEANILGSDNIQEPLQDLIQRFEGFPCEGDSMATEIDTTIHDLIVLKNTIQIPTDKLILRLRIKIPRLNAWKYRAFWHCPEGERHYWNPLHTSFRDIEAGGDVEVRLTDTPYPASDIIRNWCNIHLRA